MELFKNFRTNRTVKNAVQQTQGYNHLNGYSDNLYTRNVNYNELFFDGANKAGKYDNYYGDSSRIVSVASQYPLYYVNKKNDLIDPKEGTFAYYLDKPNEDYPLKKVLEQVYTELITHGHSDLFLWRKDGKNESRTFEDKKYNEDLFRGFTLVSGYDQTRLSKKDKENIVRITLGSSQANVFMGYSPSQAAQSWRGMQDEMGLHMTAFARNAGMPLGKFIITAPSPEDYVKMRDKLDDKISGANNNGKILYDYRPSDSKVTQIEWVQFTSQDVQDYTNQLEFSEKKITQGFGVPGTIKGTNDGENYATARVSEQVFIKYTIKPLVESFKEQLAFTLEKRFNLTGQLKVNIPIPEIADESLVKIRATSEQVKLYDLKIAEGYSPESIVASYDLPESFLLLEKVSTDGSSSNTPKNVSKQSHSHKKRDELFRAYKSALTIKEIEEIELGYRKPTQEYADAILNGNFSDEVEEEFKGRMSVQFESKYKELYAKNLDDVANALADALESVDISDLNLTDEELEAAVEQYNRRVADFSKTFAADVAKLPGETLAVRQTMAEPNIERVVVTESEHTRIVSELQGWTKAEQDFPVRVTKTWKALPDACPECADIDGTTIDVTALFINNPNIKEIYEVQGGGLHPNCVFGDTEITATDVNNLTRFAYTGDKINIMTASGRNLSVTPNHILLTDRGWVAAKNIKDTDNIVAYGGGAERALRTPNVNNSNSVISEVFETFRKSASMTTKTVPLATVDFHGDATVNEKVDIVFPKSFLRDNGQPTLDKFGEDSFFVVGADVTPTLDSLSVFDEASMGLLAATDSRVRSFCENQPFGFSKFAHTNDVSLATVANYDSRLKEVATDNVTTDVESLREFQLANPTLVEFDKVSSVKVNFVTHEYVYDLSSYTKLYSANGFVSSNCRCIVVYEMEAEAVRDAE